MIYGHIIEPSSSEIVDEVLAVYMEAPATYTREDMAEIYCHGSTVSLRRVLSSVLSLGVRLAESGEFTKRAFLAGRIDLAQADAVIDMIKAKTDLSYDLALSQLSGGLSSRVSEIRSALTGILAEITVNIDYPDEGAGVEAEVALVSKLKGDILACLELIADLSATAETGKMIREGVNVAIIGKPNVGKSSLLNALLRENRAIVTELPGTTRDRIEEYLDIEGIPVKLTDTAGIRETEDEIEKIGVQQAREAAEAADIILFVVDGSCELTEEDTELLEAVSESARGKVVILENKSDLNYGIYVNDVGIIDTCVIAGSTRNLEPISKISVSSKTGDGISWVKSYIKESVLGDKVKVNDGVYVTSIRHKDLLAKAQAALLSSIASLESGEALDFAETDIKEAYDNLGEITGETLTSDILDRVFAEFCVGK
jgi:tRNA modification GTPase